MAYDEPGKMPTVAILAAAAGPAPEPDAPGAVYLPPALPAPEVPGAVGTEAGVAARILAGFTAARTRLSPGCLTAAVLAEADATAAALARAEAPTRSGMAMVHAVLLSALVGGLAPSAAERLRRPLAASGDSAQHAARPVLARLRRRRPGRDGQTPGGTPDTAAFGLSTRRADSCLAVAPVAGHPDGQEIAGKVETGAQAPHLAGNTGDGRVSPEQGPAPFCQ